MQIVLLQQTGVIKIHLSSTLFGKDTRMRFYKGEGGETKRREKSTNAASQVSYMILNKHSTMMWDKHTDTEELQGEKQKFMFVSC